METCELCVVQYVCLRTILPVVDTSTSTRYMMYTRVHVCSNNKGKFYIGDPLLFLLPASCQLPVGVWYATYYIHVCTIRTHGTRRYSVVFIDNVLLLAQCGPRRTCT